MKLLRLKITDPEGFRSLQYGFEYHFRTEWTLQDEQGFAPFVCAGPNGSGKSNLLEVLAAIFFQLEVLRVRRSFLPEVFFYDEVTNPNGMQDGGGIPNAFELEYFIRPPKGGLFPLKFPIKLGADVEWAHVRIEKREGHSPEVIWVNKAEFDAEGEGYFSEDERDFLLPQYVLGYSSGENEILSLPFFKMRFVQFDEYWNALQKELPYSGRPETRMAYLDSGFSQAILLCNLLFEDKKRLKNLLGDVGLEALQEFRIILRRTIQVSSDEIGNLLGAWGVGGYGKGRYGAGNPALLFDEERELYTVNLMQLLESDDESDEYSSHIVNRLRRCATCSFEDEESDTLYLDFCVNEATREAFRKNFGEEGSSPSIALFQAFQVLLTLNFYSVSQGLKRDLYQSDSHYVSETVPVLASDERIMRFKFVQFSKKGIEQPVMLKDLSDGEHQLLHTLGLCMLFRGTNSLFLLDEPETHFNPDWRANFISRLHEVFEGSDSQEMLVTTHTPFLISDSRPEKVLVFNKEGGVVSVSHPEYNTLGASINKITMATFDKRETIGLRAQGMLNEFRKRSRNDGEDKGALITEINHQLGDSVEKVLLIKTILDSMEEGG